MEIVSEGGIFILDILYGGLRDEPKHRFVECFSVDNANMTTSREWDKKKDLFDLMNCKWTPSVMTDETLQMRDIQLGVIFGIFLKRVFMKEKMRILMVILKCSQQLQVMQ